MIIEIVHQTGEFAENKEQASSLRNKISKALRDGEDIVLDFGRVAYATQSFVHALIADPLRDESLDALDRMEFRNCSDAVRSVIEIVVSYSQDDWAEEPAAV